MRTILGERRINEPMAQHTSWRVGGPARLFYKPVDRADLSAFLAQLEPNETIVWLGLGSNLLVRDGGIQGVVIATQTMPSLLEKTAPNRVRAEAGVTCAKFGRFVAQCGLVGAEFMAGIPGTLGGALAMNAGAFGGETWRQVVALETMDRSGHVHQRAPSDFEVSYRHVRALTTQGEEEWFISAEFEYPEGDISLSRAEIKALLAKRNLSQPIGLASCGSVFTNPVGDFAARLIDTAGLKGLCRGQACVSEKHANFIINCGNATAADIEDLILEVQTRVAKVHGVHLVPEVRIIGARLS